MNIKLNINLTTSWEGDVQDEGASLKENTSEGRHGILTNFFEIDHDMSNCLVFCEVLCKAQFVLVIG